MPRAGFCQHRRAWSVPPDPGDRGGAALALLILSGMSVEAFRPLRAQSDATALTRLPGIGKKTAERLIIEMRDRIGELGPYPATITRQVSARDGDATPRDDAISALVALGLQAARSLAHGASLDTEGLASEAIIRLALQSSVRR